MPRLALLVLVALLSWTEAPSAQDTVKVGVLKLTSSAPIFVGVERGFFKEYGAWWQKHGFVKATIPLKDIVDTSFLEAAITAVKD